MLIIKAPDIDTLDSSYSLLHDIAQLGSPSFYFLDAWYLLILGVVFLVKYPLVLLLNTANSNVLKQPFIHPYQPIYATQNQQLVQVKRQETVEDIMASYL